MKKSVMYFRMLFKRQMKRWSIYVILFAICLSTVFIRHAAMNFAVKLEIGVAKENSDGENEMADNVLSSMEEHRGLVSFQGYADEKTLKNAVRKGEVYAGYYFTENFTGDKDMDVLDKSIRVYAQPDSFVPKIANELVFSYVMQEYAYQLLCRDTVDTGAFDEMDSQEIRSELGKYYRENLTNGSTFSLEYSGEKEVKDATVELDVFDYLSPVAKGLVGIFIFASGLCGTLLYYRDREEGVFSRFGVIETQLFCLMEIFIPVILSAATGFLCLLGTGIWEMSLEKVLHILLYLLGVTLYCYVLRILVPGKKMFLTMIPVFLMASLLFCHVFVNLSAIVPAFDVISKILPPTYF